MTNSEWLKSLSVGDKVSICSYGCTPRLEPVVKTTATQIVLSRDVRYRKDNGRRTGKDYNYSRIEEPTQAILEQIEKFDNVRGKSPSLGQLRQVMAILEPQDAGEGSENG